MSEDSSRQSERRISTDRETIRDWADEHEAVPVRHQSGETEELRLVPESQLGEDHERLEWDVFHDELQQEEYAVFYHGETGDQPFEVTSHDDALARSNIEDEQLRERLLEGETVTSEVQETTVVESVVVEEATVESELIGSDIVDQQIIDVELVERGCSNCELVTDREGDDREWFDTNRYMSSLASTPGGQTMADDTATAEGGTADVDQEYPYYAEFDVEETWAVTRELTERFTVESRITDTDVMEADTVEDHDIDVQGLQRSILEQGLLGVDEDPDIAMTEYEVETELDEADRIETYFERTQVVEDDVVDRRRARADITDADLTQMEIINEQQLSSEMPDQATEMDAEMSGSESAQADDRVTLSQEDVDKDVVDANGDKVGTVDSVTNDGQMMTVDAHSGLTDKIMSALNWGDEDEHENNIYAGQIAEVTDDEVRLKEHEELGEHRNVHESS